MVCRSGQFGFNGVGIFNLSDHIFSNITGRSFGNWKMMDFSGARQKHLARGEGTLRAEAAPQARGKFSVHRQSYAARGKGVPWKRFRQCKTRSGGPLTLIAGRRVIAYFLGIPGFPGFLENV